MPTVRGVNANKCVLYPGLCRARPAASTRYTGCLSYLPVNRHFGLEIARSLASAGCDLVITSRSLADAEASAASLAEEYNVKAEGLALDVSEYSSVEHAFEDAITAMGHVDILVNNAGGGSGPGANVGGIFDRSNAAVEALIQANLMGSFWCWCVHPRPIYNCVSVFVEIPMPALKW
eukprot:COSAG02_NODE_2027_length_10079_cov_10.855311_2_plen_177_part_00